MTGPTKTKVTLEHGGRSVEIPPHLLKARQLTLDVKQMEAAKRSPIDGGEAQVFVVGTMKVNGTFRVDRDMNHGDEVHIRLFDADGVLLSEATAEVKDIGFPIIEEKGVPLGIERRHKAKVVEA